MNLTLQNYVLIFQFLKLLYKKMRKVMSIQVFGIVVSMLAFYRIAVAPIKHLIQQAIIKKQQTHLWQLLLGQILQAGNYAIMVSGSGKINRLKIKVSRTISQQVPIYNVHSHSIVVY